MRKILTILCSLLFVAQFSAVSAQEYYWYEWKDGAVSVRAVSSLDSVTFSLGDWIYNISCSPAVEITKSSFSAEATVSLGKGVKNVLQSPNIGVCYSDTNDKPTIKDGNKYLGSNLQSYSFKIENLRQDLKYYYRTYVQLLDTVFYGDVCSTVLDKSCTINGHKFVDFGLSVLWAETNVGANSATDCGNYYAWAETAPKDSYTWHNYKFGKPYYGLSKYSNSDQKVVIESVDDVATINWGAGCRIPTNSEFEELKNNCIWTWTTQNGVSGYKVTSKRYIENSIFLPAHGYRQGGDVKDGSRGYYWSSRIYDSYKYDAYYFYLNSSFYNCYSCEGRYFGRSIRPVAER